MPNLLDIQIGVENGSSPFSESSYNGLLKLNASFDGVQPAIINPIVPYLFMSPETCAAVTEHLPVTLDSQIGLYIWNTTDSQYERIVNSPAYLAFVFQKAGSGNLTIKVPFRLLSLTLEAPIVTAAQQYFPCRPFHTSDNSSDYFLGKAFLQAAFIGMNWQESKFFLAQAPGPGVGASNIRPITSQDTMIDNDPIDNFAVTWASDWTALSDTGYNNNAGLSTGTKAGIAVGVIVSILVVAGVLLANCMQRRRTVVPLQEKVVPEEQDITVYEKDGVAQVPELGKDLPHEASNDHEIHELNV